ncbi:MAG: tetratricopeptide repeat-containing sensor histidine kinase [Flavobacterium sp.]
MVTGSLYSQNYQRIDSLQYIADTCSRAGLNYKAAAAQNDVDAGFMIASNELRANAAYRNAQAYIRSRKYDDAFYYITKSFGIKCELKDSIGIAYCYSVMGQIYLFKKDHVKAGRYNRQAIGIFERNTHKKENSVTAKVLYADFLISQKKYAAAMGLLSSALADTPGTGFYNSEAYIKDRMGLCCFMMGDNEKAVMYYRQALADEAKNPYVDIRMGILLHLGELYLSGKDIAKARLFFEKCISLRPATEQNEDYIKANRLLSGLYESLGNYEQAYNYGMEAIQAGRELMDEVMITSAEAQTVKFDAEQLSLQNSLLQATAETQKVEAQQADARKNAFLFGFIFTILVLATVLAFLYFYFRQKRAIATNRNNELKQKLLLTQMNPHFIFNSVDNIQSLIYEDKNDEAADYLSKFSRLTLQILNNSSLQYISLKEELSMTANYLVIQQLLYDNFNFEIVVDEGIDKETVYIPPMLTQPFIENAIKHGIAGKKEGGMIRVKFYKRGRSLIFEVTDNGRGLTGARRTGHKSMATHITAERLNASDGGIKVASIIEDGIVKGAVSRFAIPYKIKNRHT